MQAVKQLWERAATRTPVHVGFAFLAMGGWAVFANRNHPIGEALLAGLVQGTVSGLLTLVLKKFLEWMNRQWRGWAALVLPPLITASAIMAILQTAHRLAGTPEIWATIAVPFTVSTSYAIVYNWSLWKRHGR